MAYSLRQAEILRLAQTEGRVATENLAQRFRVTVQTIRRDLGDMDAAGLLSRVYGGAILRSGVENIGYDDRRTLNAEAKEAIGQAVAGDIPDRASVFLDIGTTAEAVASALLGHRGLLLMTNNLNIANIAARAQETEVIVAGGALRRSDGGLVGDITADAVRQFKPDVAVISASALDSEGDLLDYDFREAGLGRVILGQARKTFLAVDASKFRRTAPVKVASVRDVDTVYTDAPPPPGFAARCQDWDTKIVIAPIRA